MPRVMSSVTASAPRARVAHRSVVARGRRSSAVTRASAEENAAEAQRWIDNWKSGGKSSSRSGVAMSGDRASADATRELKDGELSIKRGLFATFIREGEEEVSAEKYRAFQAEIAEKKAAAKKRQEEARANKKGPFGLW